MRMWNCRRKNPSKLCLFFDFLKPPLEHSTLEHSTQNANKYSGIVLSHQTFWKDSTAQLVCVPVCQKTFTWFFSHNRDICKVIVFWGPPFWPLNPPHKLQTLQSTKWDFLILNMDIKCYNSICNAHDSGPQSQVFFIKYEYTMLKLSICPMYMIWEYFYNNSKCAQGERERVKTRITTKLTIIWAQTPSS
jgi:hypothetical protein